MAVFSEGVIQQLAPPEELYERPGNSFVAQFVGENNTFAGEVVSVDGDKVVVETKGGERLKAIAVNCGGVGTQTVLSVRPERMRLGILEKISENTLPARVEELIFLGDHKRCRVSVNGHNDCIVKIPNSSDETGINLGDQTSISFLMEDCRALNP